MEKPKVQISQEEIDKLKAIKAAIVNNNEVIRK